MALNSPKMETAIGDAFKKGQEITAPDADGNSEAKYSDADVAGWIMDAIVNYAAEAEVTIYAPWIHTIPPVPPAGIMGTPDPSVIMTKLKPASPSAGGAALKAAILAGLAPKTDPAFIGLTTGVPIYAATLIAWKDSSGMIMAAGLTAMPAPPIFVNAMVMGIMHGADSEFSDQPMRKVAGQIALMIHNSFKATMFTGAGAKLALSAGPVISTLS